MMTEAEIAALRDDLETLMPETCTIQRVATTNTGGNVTESWSDASTSACRLDPFNMKDGGQDITKLLDRETVLSTYRLTLPYDADIQEGDRIAKGSQIFQIVQLSDVHDVRACRRAVISRIQGE